MRHLRVNEVARRAFDSFLPRSFSLLLALSRFLSHVFCLLFLAFLHAFARSFGKRLLLERVGNPHHTLLFSFPSPLVFRVSNAVKKYIISHLLYLVSSILSFGLEWKPPQFDTYERRRLSEDHANVPLLKFYASIVSSAHPRSSWLKETPLSSCLRSRTTAVP